MDIQQPQDLMTFQWIAITVLAAIAGYLFRQLRKETERNSKFQIKLLEKTLTGLKDSNEVSSGLADAFEMFTQQFSMREEIKKLRREIRNDKKD